MWPVPWRLVLHLLEDIDQTDPAYRVYTKGANGDSTLWDDPATAEVETRTEVLLGALSRALDLLEQKFGSPDMNTWLWGKLHQAQFVSRHRPRLRPRPVCSARVASGPSTSPTREVGQEQIQATSRSWKGRPNAWSCSSTRRGSRR